MAVTFLKVLCSILQMFVFIKRSIINLRFFNVIGMNSFTRSDIDSYSSLLEMLILYPPSQMSSCIWSRLFFLLKNECTHSRCSINTWWIIDLTSVQQLSERRLLSSFHWRVYFYSNICLKLEIFLIWHELGLFKLELVTCNKIFLIVYVEMVWRYEKFK